MEKRIISMINALEEIHKSYTDLLHENHNLMYRVNAIESQLNILYDLANNDQSELYSWIYCLKEDTEEIRNKKMSN